MKITIPKHIKTALKIILSLGILGFVIYKIDIKQLAEIFSKVNPAYLIAALAFFALSKLISAFRLNNYLGKVDIDISDKYNIRLYLLGMFYNLFLPGGIGGDGYKIYLLNKRFDVKAKRIFWAILIDRVIGLLALFCLAVGLSLFIPIPIIYKYFVWLLIPISVIVFYFVIKRFFGHFLTILFKTLGQSLLVQLSQVVSAIFILASIHTFDHTLEYILYS
nr:flippase-like domain-containing protein [Bacteroidota bacterium]